MPVWDDHRDRASATTPHDAEWLEYDDATRPVRQRVRMDLDGGHMDVSLDPDASPATVAALRELGQAAVNRMRKDHHMATRAKFRCNSVTDFGANNGEKAVLGAVTDDGNAENKAFWNATPAGTLEITVNNPDVRGFFKPGQSYYLDISEASSSSSLIGAT